MTTDEQGYARLPEDLLHGLLSEAGPITDTVAGMLASSIEHRDQLRRGLSDLGLLRRFNTTTPSPVAAVDGGFAIERTLAVDLLLSVAVGVEGLGAETRWDSNQYRWWARALPHQIESERLARGLMVAQELAILSEAPHELRILDGSHLTLVIQLNAALTTQSQEIRALARDEWAGLRTIESLAHAATDPSLIAMPKYDSSDELARRLSKETGVALAGDDKYLLGMLLDAGELVEPQRVPDQPWQQLHFDARPGDEDLEEALAKAIQPLVRRELWFTYFKPDDASPAYRIEMKEDAVHDLDRICSTLADQITGPFVREPYPQYLADVMAKSVGFGLSALQAAVQYRLSSGGQPDIARLLIRSYRTEGT
ncbi:MAG: hypothetical protein F4Y96_01335 [Chloroflexi bacterium]|nr:hypothetical protein [Chloroflexota bacterium]